MISINIYHEIFVSILHIPQIFLRTAYTVVCVPHVEGHWYTTLRIPGFEDLVHRPLLQTTGKSNVSENEYFWNVAFSV
jgi:hypothetical protein